MIVPNFRPKPSPHQAFYMPDLDTVQTSRKPQFHILLHLNIWMETQRHGMQGRFEIDDFLSALVAPCDPKGDQ